MGAIQRLGRDDVTGRDLFILDILSSQDLPERLSLASSRFVCLVAWDARQATVEEISRLARQLLNAGAVYVCAWGPGCERVHDIVDEEFVGQNPTPIAQPVVMTTWHTKESLGEVIEFALVSAWPDEAFEDECRSTLGISIGSTPWGEEIRTAFSNPRGFVAKPNSN